MHLSGPSVHEVDWRSALVRLDALGWEPTPDEYDGGPSEVAETDDGRTVVGLCGREPVVTEPSVAECARSVEALLAAVQAPRHLDDVRVNTALLGVVVGGVFALAGQAGAALAQDRLAERRESRVFRREVYARTVFLTHRHLDLVSQMKHLRGSMGSKSEAELNRVEQMLYGLDDYLLELQRAFGNLRLVADKPTRAAMRRFVAGMHRFLEDGGADDAEQAHAELEVLARRELERRLPKAPGGDPFEGPRDR